MLQALRQPPPKRLQSLTLPAPLGMNVVDNAGGLPPGDAVEIVNMVRSQYGLRSRSGYREWVTGIGSEVRTLLDFQGSTGTEDRLFACVQSGIYDCTSSTSTPSSVYAWGTADANSGKCIAHAFTKLDGTHAMLVCDEANGYVYYNEAGDTWTAPTAGTGAGQINGADPATFSFVTVWKKRAWFAIRDSAIGCYLPADSLTGQVELFDFGPQFKHGGTLVGLWTWTKDGVDSLDDYLVAVSSSGDVVVYQGFDPNVFGAFSLVGSRYVGAVPAGRRICSDFGGELVILTHLGLLPISKLFAGIITPDSYVSAKIGPLIGQELTDRGTSYGWDIKVHPEDKTLVVMTPAEGSSDREQWVFSLISHGWAKHTGVPMNCIAPWKGKFYFGTTDGRVCINDGDVDNNQLTGSTNATAIEWSLLTGFADQGTPQQKRPSMARPTFMTDGTAPQYSLEARFDYNRAAIGSITYVSTSSTSTWGSAVWGSSTWGSGIGTAGWWRGLSGMGSSVALALKGASMARTTLTSMEITFTVGGRAM